MISAWVWVIVWSCCWSAVLVAYGLGQEALDPMVLTSLLGDGLMYGSNDLS